MDDNIIINIQDIKKQIKSNGVEKTLDVINALKAKKVPIQNLDLARALCILELKLPYYECSAEQALLEELRFYPENKIAQELIESIRYQINIFDKNIYDFNDEEFQKIVSVISDYTMLPYKRLYNLWENTKKMLKSSSGGFLVECGVAAGGSTAMIAYLVKKYGNNNFKVYAFDSFEGLPKEGPEDLCEGNEARGMGWGCGTCYATEKSLEKIAEILGVKENIVIVKGYYETTLNSSLFELNDILLLHVDCDWYKSVQFVLDRLYPKVKKNGFIQIDDYGYWAGVKKAVDEYFEKIGIKHNISTIDGFSGWMIKE